MGTYKDYRQAAALLWGPAGEFFAAEFTRHNREHFAGSIPPMPVIIGMVPYGQCLGATLHGLWLKSPRITLSPEIFNGSHDKQLPGGHTRRGRIRGGPRQVSDTLLHEMIHAALIFRDEISAHNGDPWCKLITELSPDVVGKDITAWPVRTRRVPNPGRDADPGAPKTIVKRLPEPGAMTQMELATWPQSVRPADWYDGDKPIYVPTF